MKTVEKALREQWRDDDLSKRDRIKQYANIVLDEGEEPEDEALTANLEAPHPSQDPHGFEAFMCDQHEIDMAHQRQEKNLERGALAPTAGEDEPEVLSFYSIPFPFAVYSSVFYQSRCGGGEMLSLWRTSQDLQLSSEVSEKQIWLRKRPKLPSVPQTWK